MFLFPFCVFAHGEDVLLPMFFQVASIAVFLIWLFGSKLHRTDKLILLLSYLLSLTAVIYFTWNIPYRQNKTIIDVCWILGPGLASLTTFLILKNRKR